MFPNNIRTARKSMNLTMKRLGEMVGASESSISQYETGKRQPDNEMLLKLAEALETTVGYLLGAEQNPADKKEQPTDADELYEYLEMLRQRPGMRALLKVHQGSTDEEIAANVRFIEELRNKHD